MSHSESVLKRTVDWRGWLSLMWMLGFGLLYLAMIVREKAPGLIARLSRGF
jgi:hypothetical protein